MNKKISLFLLVSGLFFTGCNSNIILNNTSITSSSSVGEEISPLVFEFIKLVDSIVLDNNAGDLIDDAWDLYEAANGTDYPQFYDAYYKLVYIEGLYKTYRRDSKAATDFINKVNAIPYEVSINNKRLIEIAESSYENLSDEAREFLGVSQAYERLIEVRAEYDRLMLEIEEKNKIIEEYY